MRWVTLRIRCVQAPTLLWADEKSVLITSAEPRTHFVSVTRSEAALGFSFHTDDPKRSGNAPTLGRIAETDAHKSARGQKCRHGDTALQAKDLRVSAE